MTCPNCGHPMARGTYGWSCFALHADGRVSYDGEHFDNWHCFYCGASVNPAFPEMKREHYETQPDAARRARAAANEGR